MSEYQAQIDAAAAAASLEQRLTFLENVVANWMQNGAEDMFGQSGGQVYGGGVMRLDNNGIQIKTPTSGELPAIFWMDTGFSTDPASEVPKTRLVSQVNGVLNATIQMNAQTSFSNQAAFAASAQDFGTSYVSRCYPAAGFLGLGDSWALETVSGGEIDIGEIGRSLVQVRPETGTSDTLDDILGPVSTGELLVIRPEDVGDVITVAHDTAKIVTQSGSSVVLDGPNQMMGFIRLSFSGPWVELFNNTGASSSGGGGMALLVVKPSNTARQNTTSTTADPDLSVAIGANENWVYEFVFVVASSSTPDFKYQISVPSGATGMVIENARVSTTDAENYRDIGSDFTFTSASWPQVFRLTVGVDNGANAGNVALHWAQGTSDAAFTTVNAGAYIMGAQVT